MILRKFVILGSTQYTDGKIAYSEFKAAANLPEILALPYYE